MTDKFGTKVAAEHRRLKSLRATMLVASTFLTLSLAAKASAQVATPHIVIDPSGGVHPTLGHSGNGVDQLDIVGANAAGLSHNRFTDYNVTEGGLILNNATTAAQTQLGGKIAANANLNGTAAKVILNEVTGSNPTTLAGQTEIAGQQAAVVVANPIGIACSGCGFLNTSRATLTTGKPSIDSTGALKSLQVSGGEITFQGAGGDFTTVPVLDIVSRTVTLKGNARLHAQRLNVIAGRNTVDYNDVSKIEQMKPDPADKSPEFAVDTSAMGGLYADRIYMVVNENGAGVRVNGDMAANTSDVYVSASGDIVNNGHIAAEKGRVSLAVAGNVVNNATAIIDSEGDLSASVAGKIVNAGLINARNGRGQFSTAGGIENSVSGTIASRQDTSFKAAGNVTNDGRLESTNGALSINTAGNIRNRAGTVSARSGLNMVAAGTFDNDGTVQNSGGSLYISSVGNLQNSKNITNDNASKSGGAGRATFKSTAQVKNSGSIRSSGSDIDVQALSLLENSGRVEAKSGRIDLASTTGPIRNTGYLGADGNVTVKAGNAVSNRGGTINSDTGSIRLTTANWSDLDNVDGSVKAASGDISISTRNVTNNSGTVSAGRNLSGYGARYFSDKNSTFTADKSFSMSFSGAVQKLGLYGRKTGDIAQPVSEGSVAPQGNISRPTSVAPVVKKPQPQTAFPVMTWNGYQQAAWGGFYW
ncbi:filamentous hemagglutinin N-terminal domain-containing protein [Asaia sp. BMEF1]|uniref:filamentous hemagglutinin N-terminal domain-containing protein n=1 Tax=Asaia sp. BMEF1 TaxID=3155932 RepID=UPI003F674B6E